MLTGEKVVLRDITEADVTDRYLGFLNDPQVTTFLTTKPSEHTIESLRKFVKEKIDSKDCIFLSITDKKSGLHIGNIKIEPIDYENKKAVIGIMIGDKEFLGKGYGTDAMKTALDYCFCDLNLNKVALGVVSENIAASKSYRKAGFIVEGVLREDTIWNGKKYDRTLMAVLKSEYKTRRKKNA